MNRTAAETATGEICQFLNDRIEKGVPVEWHRRIRDIIERACGQDEVCPDLEHLAFSFVHGGFDPHGHGGCSCKECSWLRTRISAISRQEANEYFEAKYGLPAVETVQYIDGNLATEACEAAYKRACDTMSILEAGWKVAKTSDLSCGQEDAHKHDLRTCPAMRALEGLTPGGSEYINDIPRCVAAVRDTRDSLMKEIQRRAKREHACGQAALPSPSTGRNAEEEGR